MYQNHNQHGCEPAGAQLRGGGVGLQPGGGQGAAPCPVRLLHRRSSTPATIPLHQVRPIGNSTGNVLDKLLTNNLDGAQ